MIGSIMPFLPLIVYVAVPLVFIIIYTKKRKENDEEFFKIEQRQVPLRLVHRVGYVGPIVGLVIGAVFCFFIVGIPVLVISIVVLLARINFNKQIDLWNVQVSMAYNYPVPPPQQ